ncbi:hypothetical protein PY365_12360 [Roseiarcaceae bacterium H3SJ34-1]|uniref:hypothetical protein n=1 Tax=Terripilifer ovatus TaxID=3032367 RepID=UPI003AB965E1|nr:hypothetical protein [Roseiarcaceae bacterium H3SJ34-1]
MATLPSIVKLLAGLRREPHDYKPDLQMFPTISVERLANDLRLAERGKERGQSNEPHTDSAGADEIELAIVERIESEKRDAFSTLSDQLKVYEERLAGLDFEGRFADIRVAAAQAPNEFKTTAAQGRSELFQSRRKLRDFEIERERFKQEHNLFRPARNSTGWAAGLKWAVLLAMAVAEIFVNGSYLAKGNELGLLGGVSQAITFAALNIGMSFAFGAVLARQVNHRSLFRKIIGVLGILLFVAFAVSLNLALGHLRELSSELSSDPGVQVLQRLATAPLELTDIHTWIFVSMGLAFSAIAFGEALFIYDPYPGYGALEKRVDLAHRTYLDHTRFLHDELKEIRDSSIEAIESANRELSVRRGEYDSIISGKVRVAQMFDSFQTHLEKTGDALLAVYRDANRTTRSTPVPQRFSQPFRLERIIVSPEVPSTGARNDLRSQIASSQLELTDQVEAINSEFLKASETYSEIDKLLEKEPNASDAKIKQA